MTERLSMPLVKEAEIVDALIDQLAETPNAEGIFDEFHQAAVRDERVPHVAMAYRRVLRRTRLQHLSQDGQSCVYASAARFFADIAGDGVLAARFGEQAVELQPRNGLAKEVLEILYIDAEDVPKLAKLYHRTVEAGRDDDEQLRLARRAVALLRTLPSSEAAAASFKQKITQLDPTDEDVFGELEDFFMSSGNYRELVALLEQRLELASDSNDTIRWRVIATYRDQMHKPEEVARHLELMLEREPPPPLAVQAAEAMLEAPLTACLIAPAVAALYRRTGRSSDELSVLTRSVKDASGEALDRMQWRLAELRVELLDDPAGALEALHPLLSRAPGRDDVRALFIELSRRLDRLDEAARALDRAGRSAREPDVKAKVEWDVAQLAVERHDAKAEREAYKRVVQSGSHGAEALAAAEALLGVSDTLERKSLEKSLVIIAERADDGDRRIAAAERLLELKPAPGRKSRRIAWLALMDSGREEEALRELEVLLDPEGDAELLAAVFERRAAACPHPDDAFDYAFQAAALRARLADDPGGAVEAWRQLILSHGATRSVYAKMLPLLEASGDFAAVADTLHADSELAPDEERADILAALGDVLHLKLEDAATAIEAYRRALALDHSHDTSRLRLESMLTGPDPEICLQAAEALEPCLTPDEPVWLQIHELRADLLADPSLRLDAFRRAAELLRRSGGQPTKGRQLCGRALRFAVQGAPEQVADWIELLEWFAASSHEQEEALHELTSALDESNDTLVGEPLVVLATATGIALARADRNEEALLAWIRALAECPTAVLMRRIDALLTNSGAGLEERAERYRDAISRASERDRAELTLDLAQILENANDLSGATSICEKLLVDSPENVEVLRRVVSLLKSLNDPQGAKQALERSLPTLQHRDRAYALAELAAYEPAQAAALYTEALRCGALGEATLSTIKLFADEGGDFELQQELLEHRAQYAGDPLRSGQAFEELGRFLSEQLDADARAADAFKRSADAYQRIPAQREHAIELLEHALTLVPEDLQAAEPLMFLFVQLGQWGRVAESLTILLRSSESHHRVLDRVIGLCDGVVQSGSTTEYVALLDEILWLPELNDSTKQRDIMAVKARALAAVDGQESGAADAFRAVIESHGDSRDVLEFAAFIGRTKDENQRLEDYRWLFEWRLNKTDEPLPVLLEWAQVEEQAGDSASALGIYERLAEHDAGRATALESIRRLRLARGDWEGGFEAMGQLLPLVEAERKHDLARQMATVAVRQLFDPVRALPSLEQLLPEPEAVELALEALAEPAAAEQTAKLFDVVIEAMRQTPGELAVLLARLRETIPLEEHLKPFVKQWFAESLAVLPVDSHEYFDVGVAAVLQFPVESAFWDKVEAAARSMNAPDPVAAAYQQALQDPDIQAAQFGKRAQAFIQEWYGGNSEQSHALLEAVCDADPSVRWALDRLKLALTSSGEWQKLFVLYDRALSAVRSSEERAALLDEAAVAAKDFAGEPERALAYLEPLRELRPDDPRVETALERLYERLELRQPLAAMLEQRLPSLEGRLRRETELRLADLWMAMGEPEQALGYAEPLLDDESHHQAAARILEAIGFAPMDGSESDPIRAVVGRALEKLETYYSRYERFNDVARVMQRSAEQIVDLRSRIRRLRSLVQLDLDQLDDPQAAFNVTCSLVVLDPFSEVHRVELGELAKRTYSFARWAAALEEAANTTSDASLSLDLCIEAANVYLEFLEDRPRATKLLTEVMGSNADRRKALAAAKRVVELQMEAQRSNEYCDALERVAVLSSGKQATVSAWNAAGAAVFEMLEDANRAVADWSRVLELDGGNFEAQCGRIEALAQAGRQQELVDALLGRANSVQPESGREDRARAANVLTSLGELTSSIDVWMKLGEELGHDSNSLESLGDLLERTHRLQELADLWRSHAESGADHEGPKKLWAKLGALLSEKLNQPSEAIEAYTRAGAWNRACTVAINTPAGDQLDLLPAFLSQVLSAWRERGAEPTEELAPVVLRAVRARAQRLMESGHPGAAANALREGAELPFTMNHRRELCAEAAMVHDAEPGGRESAIELLSALVREDPLDAVAKLATPRLLGWLEQAERFEDMADIWELVARAAPDKSDRSRRSWLSAGKLWDEKLQNLARAADAYRSGAAQESLECLRALTRILEQLSRTDEAAEVLETLLARVEGEERERVVLRLANAHAALDDAATGARHIESVRRQNVDSERLRTRLVQLYESSEQYSRLAALLAEDATYRQNYQERAARLAEAADVHLSHLDEPENAVPLLSEAVSLDPDDAQLPLRLAVALSKAGDFERAVEAFDAKLAAYGERRPQERGIVHRYLARALLAAGHGDRAYQELNEAADIYPDHPGIQHELAQLALSRGELERAERTCRTLLLMLRSLSVADEPEIPSVGAVYLDLSQIATRRGDAVAAEDFVHSAFDASMESTTESLALEKELERRGLITWLRKALESRIRRSSGAEAAEALAELARTLKDPSAEPEFAIRVREEAEDLYASLVTAEVPDARAVKALAATFEAVGSEEDQERAGKMHRHLVTLRASDLRAWRSLLAWLAPRRRLSDAADLARQLKVTESAQSRPVAMELVRVLTEVPETFDAALELLKGLLYENREDVEVLELLVLTLESAGRDAELVDMLRSQLEIAVELRDSRAETALAHRLSAVLERENRIEEAADVLRSVVARDEDNIAVLRELQRVLASQGAADEEYANVLGRLLEASEGEEAAALSLRAAELRKALGDESGAQRALESGFTAYPAHRGILAALLDADEAAGRMDEARKRIERSLEADPSGCELWQKRVRLEIELGLHQTALKTVELALEYHESEPELLRVRAECFEVLGQTGEALEAAREWVSVSPEHSQRLIPFLERAIDDNEPPLSDEQELELVGLLVQNERSADAKTRLSRWLKERPSRARMSGYRTLVDLAREDNDAQLVVDALSLMMELANGDDERLELALEYAGASANAGLEGETRLALEKALSLAGGHPEKRAAVEYRLEALYRKIGAYHALGQLLLDSAGQQNEDSLKHAALVRAASVFLNEANDAGAAEPVLREALDLMPGDLGATGLLAALQAARGESAAAKAALLLAIESSPGPTSDLVDAYRLLADLQLNDDELHDAFGTLKTAHELDKQHALTAMQLGLLAVDLDDFDTAEAALRFVVLARSRDDDLISAEQRAIACYHLAHIVQWTGKPVQARMYASKGLSEHPEGEIKRKLEKFVYELKA